MDRIVTMTASFQNAPAERDRAIVSFTLNGAPDAISVPISTGIPFRRGLVRDASRLRLTTIGSPDEKSRELPAQFETLARWPDGTSRAIRLDFVTPADRANSHYQLIESDSAPTSEAAPSHLDARFEKDGIIVTLGEFGEIELATSLILTNGKAASIHWNDPRWLARGPVRWTAEMTGWFGSRRASCVTLRLTAHRGTPYLEFGVTLLNPRRASHRGGLWDLGDKHSLRFRSFEIIARRPGPHEIRTRQKLTEPGRGPLRHAAIYQDSSGGDNWNCVNHVNRAGTVPCRFRGYEYRDDQTTRETGDRATPIFALDGPRPLAVTLRHFWQQFPKGMTAAPGEIRIGLFPSAWNDDHELQPGEQKTHTLWLSLSNDLSLLDFVHSPPLPILPAEWHERCQMFDAFPADFARDSQRFADYISTAIDPATGLAARRERIDEFGWRHWGDLWADHEQGDAGDQSPIVSHYNNQYDVLEGCLRHFARTGDRAWWELAAPLARHCVDIDLYHTDQDRAVYNHGFFWHTDHYQPAQTASHRTYSRENAKGRPIYGGGPSSSHCYSTGFLHFYYLTGDPAYRDVVLGLADWLIAMEDGAKTELCVADSGPTGLSTISAEPWYHGPGRGPANTLNTLVDAWELTGDKRYRNHAEAIIRRVTGPGENIDALELLDVERRWFYIMFLLSLAKYLDAKCIAGENDAAYGHAMAVAGDYAAWMLDHERPYFEHPEQLEYPTETWGAQDIRKANAMRRLSRYCEPAIAARIRDRATSLADRGWHDLLRFDTRATLRPTAILLIEGLRDEFFRNAVEPLPPVPIYIPERHTARELFRTQRERARGVLRSPAGLIGFAGRLCHPGHWRNLSRALKARL